MSDKLATDKERIEQAQDELAAAIEQAEVDVRALAAEVAPKAPVDPQVSESVDPEPVPGAPAYREHGRQGVDSGARL